MRGLAELVRETEALHSQLASELQEMEKTILTMDHRVRGLVADLGHAEQRLNVALTEIERFAEERVELERTLAEAQAQLMEIAAVKSAIEEEIRQRSIKSEELQRRSRESTAGTGRDPIETCRTGGTTIHGKSRAECAAPTGCRS